MKSVLLALFLATAPATPSYNWKLTPAGWGPARIGMTRDQVQQALTIELTGEEFDNQGRCIQLFPVSEALRGIYFMFIDGKLSRISVADPSRIETPRGIHAGSTADEIRRAYGEKLQAETHAYLGEPAEYLSYWLKPKVRGVGFETDVQRKVQAIYAGNDSIRLIEGCA